MSRFPRVLDAVIAMRDARLATRHLSALREDREADALKRLRHQRRADHPRKLAASERPQAALFRIRDRAPRETMAREADDVPEVVPVTDTPGCGRDDAFAVFRPQTD